MPALITFLITGDVFRNSRAIRQIRALHNGGFRVQVVAIKPPHDHNLTVTLPSHVTRLAISPSAGPRFFWNWQRRLNDKLKTTEADIYHASDLYSLPAAVRASHKNKTICTYDARELYSHVASTIGKPWSSYFWSFTERQSIKSCSAIFTVNDSIADHLANTYRIERPTVIHNVPDTSQLPAALEQHVGFRKILNLSEHDVVVVHQGQIREYRGCEVLIRAMPHTHKHVNVVFLGDGPLKENLINQAIGNDTRDRVHFLDPVSPDRLLELTRSADVGVTLLEDVCLNHRFALPNKLFEYLAAGVPTLGTDLPEIRKVIESFDVGLLCKPCDPLDTARQLNRMVDDPRSRQRWSHNCAAVFETFNWEAASQRFVNTFHKLTDG